MTTNKPEIVAYLSRDSEDVVSQQEHAGWVHNAFRNPDTEYGNYQRNKTLEYSEPLICLRDYEALQAGRDALVKALEAAQKEAVRGINHARNGAQAAAALGRVSAICGAALEAHRKQRGEV